MGELIAGAGPGAGAGAGAGAGDGATALGERAVTAPRALRTGVSDLIPREPGEGPEVPAEPPTPDSWGKVVLKILVITTFVILLLLFIIALLPIIPFWLVTYHSFWGEYGFLRLIITKYRNF